MRRIFGDGQNPLDWALPLYTAWGIRVRVHIVFIIYIIAQLLISGVGRDSLGLAYVASGMATLFLLVLLHEYGHCFVCRRVGGEANDILMWPLGGLAFCMPPDHWRAHFWTTAGGPLVNVALLPILGGAVFLATGNVGAAVFNPFDPGLALAEVRVRSGQQPYWLVAIWFAHLANMALLAFNVLVPMYPMDGGRLLHALLWRKMGYGPAMEITATVGIVAAIVLVVFGLVTGQTLLFAIGLLGGFTCWQQRMMLRFQGAGGFSGMGGMGASAEDEGWKRAVAQQEREAERERKARQKQAEAQAEVDRILDKISKHGLQSLTKKEQATLKQASGDPSKK